jgi:hypothetical protein
VCNHSISAYNNPSITLKPRFVIRSKLCNLTRFNTTPVPQLVSPLLNG